MRRLLMLCLAVGCVPAGVDYDNPSEDAGPADADSPDANLGDGSVIDTGPSGRVDLVGPDGPIDSTTTYDFGLVVVGSTQTATFKISNGTSEPISLIGQPLVGVGGSGAGAFHVLQPTSAFVGAGSELSFDLSAVPLGEAPTTADVVIAHASGQLTFSVAVAGRDSRIYVGAGGDGRRALSTDGVFWTNEETFPGSSDSNLFRGIVYGDGVFVAVGGGQNGLMMWSETGSDWNDISDDQGWFGGAAFGNGLFVAAGANGRVLRSTNGRNWLDPSIDYEPHFRDLAFGNGVFVAVGDQGRRAVTTDGNGWTSDVRGGPGLNAIVFAGDRFVAVGDGSRLMTSFDGITWDEQIQGQFDHIDVAYGAGTIVSVGSGSHVVSTDGGVTWTSVPAELLVSIEFGNGRFVGTGDNFGVAYTSDDGFNWTRHDNAGAAGFTKIAFGASR